MIRDFDNIDEVAKLLIANDVEVGLLYDFIEEALESQAVYNTLLDTAADKSENQFTQEFLDNLKMFSTLLGKVKSKYPNLTQRSEHRSERERRRAMLESVERFIGLLSG